MNKEQQLEAYELFDKAIKTALEIRRMFYISRTERRVAIQDYVSKLHLSQDLSMILTDIMYRYALSTFV